MGNDGTNVYAKFRNFPLRIKKALGIYRKRVTTRTTTVVAIRDAFQHPKRHSYQHSYPKHYSVIPASEKLYSIKITFLHKLDDKYYIVIKNSTHVSGM